jgi:hypothetical protein
VHAPSEEKSDDSKGNFYEELEQVFYTFSSDFNAKLAIDNNFKPTIGNECLHHDSSSNSVRIVNFAI